MRLEFFFLYSGIFMGVQEVNCIIIIIISHDRKKVRCIDMTQWVLEVTFRRLPFRWFPIRRTKGVGISSFAVSPIFPREYTFYLQLN